VTSNGDPTPADAITFLRQKGKLVAFAKTNGFAGVVHGG